eukprot:COSAG01_NODE_69041_length_262_cov_1.042945_1_plen_34_part_01
MPWTPLHQAAVDGDAREAALLVHEGGELGARDGY